MGIIYEERFSDSPYVETIMRGWTDSDGATIRPSEVHWYLVFAKHNGRIHPLFVGPLTTAGVVSYIQGAEILWIRFRLGTFMPHLPPKNFLDVETLLPCAAGRSFWLKGSAWQYPDYDNVETFIDKLVRASVLVHDPVVNAALQDHPPAMSSRTLRHRFLRATGLTQLHVHQARRAQQAQALLQQGTSILDTVFIVGYYDQPHMTRALKQFLGHTPRQIIQMKQPG